MPAYIVLNKWSSEAVFGNLLVYRIRQVFPETGRQYMRAEGKRILCSYKRKPLTCDCIYEWKEDEDSRDRKTIQFVIEIQNSSAEW